MEEKKNILTYSGLKKLEDELEDLKVNQRKMIAQKIKEAREQGDLSENAEYDSAKDEQRDIELRIEDIEKILKNVEVVDESEAETDRINIAFGNFSSTLPSTSITSVLDIHHPPNNHILVNVRISGSSCVMRTVFS